MKLLSGQKKNINFSRKYQGPKIKFQKKTLMVSHKKKEKRTQYH